MTQTLAVPMNTNSFENLTKLTIERHGVTYEHAVCFALLTKQDLVFHFGLSDNRALRKKVFTNEVLEECKIDLDTYNLISGFDLLQTFRIKRVLELEWIRVPRKKQL